MHGLRDVHATWGYAVIAANGVVGGLALLAWRVPQIRGRQIRGRWLWVATITAEVAMILQVLTGAVLEMSKEFAAAKFHMFYGFVAFITVGLAYGYRSQMRGRREMLYGLVGLFLMGLGIRAVLQAT